MNISPVNNNITTNYYNHTKTNNAPAFKGQFLEDDSWNYRDTGISTDIRDDINQFFKKYMSPGVNVATDVSHKVYYAPWYDGWQSINLLEVPKECCDDKNFYIINAKAIEDDVLDSMINYIKKCNISKKSEDFKQKLNKYINTKKAYFKKYEKAGRFSASYGVKLEILENMVRGYI